MGALEDVMAMRSQGYQDQDIIAQLRQQGISPKEINDAVQQSKIKMAISDYPQEQQPLQDYPQYNQQNYPQYPEQQYQQQEMYPMQEQYPEQQYQQTGTDSIIQISEQVFDEKSKKLQKDVDKLNEFKSINQTKIDNLSERLKRIEEIIDKLQISILDKIGSYGDDLNSIKKEMEMMEDSFGKVVNPLLDKTESKTKSHSKK